MPGFLANILNLPLKCNCGVVRATPAIPSSLEGSGGKQNTDKKLVWSTVHPYCEFNSNCYKGGRTLQKWCRAVALIPQAAGDVSGQEVAELQQRDSSTT